ncbi:alpha-L-rhamnosidase [Ktedonobacter sp. SOSP1-52]|nr:alpha-L-rhamnosidase [Ktedonobacter sp. SOSP1-52]
MRVWGNDGCVSDWSEPALVEAGLLQAEDWSAQCIRPAWDEDPSIDQPAPLLRRAFTVRPGLASARLYITALGVYEAEMNGVPVGDHVLAPGWTSYHHRLRYQTFDVTELVREGANAIGATLGDGWFRGRLGYSGGRRNIYGEHVALLAQLELRYADGSMERVETDKSWHAARGSILSSSLYDGETYDARLARPGWSQAGYDASDWAGVTVVAWDKATLYAPDGPPVRRIEERPPVAIFLSPSGRTLVDFGQNLVGRLRIRVQGRAGTTITLRHAEVLEHGELGTRPLRLAKATDRYTLCGEGVETWEPRFTFHGFRYAEVEGWPGELCTEDLCAIVCHSDMERTGWFECSEPLLNQLHENVLWSMRGNFLDIPTDCPQRDERLGWTGDLQVFAPTATFLYHCAGFLQSWLADLAADQRDVDGVVPFVVPDILHHDAGGSAGGAAVWSDAAVIVPWVLYQRFGDTGILARQFESMRSWVDVMAERAGPGRLWNTGFQFGDWLDPTAPPDRPEAAPTDKYLIATASFAYSAELLSRAAGVLGRQDEARHYSELANEVRRAFVAEYVTANGRIVSDTPTAYTLALAFGLLSEEKQRASAGKQLVGLVRDSGYHISTGFVGTPLICDALCSVGAYDAAYRLLLQRECPSWLYPVTMGATTIWERWDSLLPDGTINPGEMTSFNHYALGAIGDWLHRVLGGLASASPGYRRISIAPRPGGGLSRATVRHQTPYGLASVAWRIANRQMSLEVVVPPNTTAVVTLPGSDEASLEVGSGTHRWVYAYTLADTRPKLTLDHPLSAFLDDPQAGAIVTATLSRFIPQAGVQMQGASQGYSALPLRAILSMLPNTGEISAAIEKALADLNERSQESQTEVNLPEE